MHGASRGHVLEGFTDFLVITERGLIHSDDELTSEQGVELRHNEVVATYHGVIAIDILEQVEETGLTCASFLAHEHQDRQELQRTEIGERNPIEQHLVVMELLFRILLGDLTEQLLNSWPLALDGLIVEWAIHIEEAISSGIDDLLREVLVAGLDGVVNVVLVLVQAFACTIAVSRIDDLIGLRIELNAATLGVGDRFLCHQHNLRANRHIILQGIVEGLHELLFGCIVEVHTAVVLEAA